MREVKEKSPLKARAAETLKSAPQAAFRRGADAAFQQLRQELRDAAQDGQPEDRYESSKITDTADHAVREVRHLAEKAAHRLPKTKSEPQRESRTKSVPQHEQSRQPTTVPREYPPVSAQPSYLPQVKQSVQESASPIREKPVSPASGKQPKMREHTPTADVPVQQSRHPASQIHEKSQVVSCSQVNQPVRELWSSVKEKSAVKAKPAEQRPLVQASSSAEPTAPATASTVPPAARTLPREKPPVSALREIPAALKPDTTQFALPEIKTKAYIRKKRKKQNFLKEEANGIENITADSKTFSPVIRTRETVREQQKLHVSHSAEQEQPALPQIRTRQPQAVVTPVDAESAKPDAPQPSLPDIKSKRKYIAAQQPTQVTPVQANPQQVVRQTGRKTMHGEQKLCQPTKVNETVTMPANRNVAPAKPARVQKQARPAFVKKQKIKTAPKAKIKDATPAAKALPSKASAAAPKQAVTAIRKGQLLRDTAIKTAKVAKEAGRKVLRAIVAAAEKLAAAIGAGGAAAVSVVVVILLVGMLFASPLRILFAGEDTGTEIKIPDAVATLNLKEALNYTRKLKLLGIGVQFEEDGINTLAMADEMLLNTFAAIAQEESKSISQHQRLSIVKRMESGDYIASNAPYGYRLIDKKLVIYEPEAEVVRWIFAAYLNGMSTVEIAHELSAKSVLTKGKKEQWKANRIAYILSNEKYDGDTLFQKYYGEETVPFKKHRNYGEMDQFFAYNTHDAILPQGMFQAVQTLLQSRSRKFGRKMSQSEYPLTRRIRCSECGSFYHRKVRSGVIKWVCAKHAADTNACNSSYYSEERIYDGIITMINKLRFCEEDILGQTIQKLEFAAAAYKRNNRAASQLSQSIAELNAKLLALERLRSKGYLAADIYHTQAREIRQQLGKLKTERCSSFESRITTMLEDVRKLKSLIDELEQPLEVFDEKLFHEIVTDICINNRDEMTVTLLGGLKFIEQI